MNKRIITKVAGTVLSAVMVMSMMTGCGNSSANQEVTIDEKSAAVAKSGEIEASDSFFKEGVYFNYAAEAENPPKTYFYVFHGDGTGSIEDGAANTGNFFVYEESRDDVTFFIGSIDPIEEVFKVKSIDNGVVTGSFDDGIELVFEPVPDVDADTFSAVNYVNAQNGDDYVYTDANGWSVKYDPEYIQVNSGGPETTFVFIGNSAGTNMITATYTVDNNAKDAIKEIGKTLGDAAYYTEGVFPGTEDVKGYWVQVTPENGGSGAYVVAMARDYMDGALIFRLDGHNGEDEGMNMLVSDIMANVIDSLEFPYEMN